MEQPIYKELIYSKRYISKICSPTIRNGQSMAKLEKVEVDKLSEIWATFVIV